TSFRASSPCTPLRFEPERTAERVQPHTTIIRVALVPDHGAITGLALRADMNGRSGRSLRFSMLVVTECVEVVLSLALNGRKGNIVHHRHRPLPSLDSLFFKGLSRDVCGRSMDDDGRSDRRSLALASSAKPLFLLGMNDDGRSGRSFPALCLAWERKKMCPSCASVERRLSTRMLRLRRKGAARRNRP